MSIVKTIADSGTGRSFCFLAESGKALNLAKKILESSDSENRKIIMELPPIKDNNWKEISAAIIAELGSLKIRQTSLVGISSAGAIAQNLVLNQPKLVRTLVLVDSASRAHPSKFSIFIDWLESHLPLGLPLRKRVLGFDSKPYLQRLRCPTLVATTAAADEHIRQESKNILNRAPSAWEANIPSASPEKELAELIKNLENVPAKCPQKNK